MSINKILKNKFESFVDNRGSLLPLSLDLIPFKPKRIFVVNDVPVGCVRGNHSHHKTEQYLICTQGSVDVFLDDGYNTKTINLNKNEGVLIPYLVWDSQKFLTKNTEILVICSTEYDINDYILTYDEFIKSIENNE